MGAKEFNSYLKEPKERHIGGRRRDDLGDEKKARKKMSRHHIRQ